MLTSAQQAALYYARKRRRLRRAADATPAIPGPTDISLSATSFDEDALSGSTVATISATSDTPDATYTYALTDDSNGLFTVEGNLLKLATTLPSGEEIFLRDITIQGTLVETGGTYSETFTLSITPVDTTNDSGLGDADGTLVPVGEFTLEPSVGGNSGNLKFKGKNSGLAYFVYDIGAVVAGETYTFSYIPYFSELSNQGKEAFVGFGFKSGDSFHLSGLKGDGATGLNKHKIYGTALTPGNYTSTGSGAVTNGTQAGPNWIQVEISEDGTTYTLRTSADGTTWADEFTAAAPDPFADTTTPTTFGLAVYLESTDKGSFSLDVTQWVYDSGANLGPYNVALISENSSSASFNETSQALVSLGHTVTYVAESAIGSTDFSAYDLLVTTRTNLGSIAATGSALNTLNDGGKPIILGFAMSGAASTSLNNVMTQMGLSGTTATTGIDQKNLNLLDGSHPILTGITTGVREVFTVINIVGSIGSGQSFLGTEFLRGTGGNVNGLPAGVAIDAGTARLTSGTTGARIVIFPTYKYSDDYNALHISLLGNAAKWAVSGQVA